MHALKFRGNPEPNEDVGVGGGSELPASRTLYSRFPSLLLWLPPLNLNFFYYKILCNIAICFPISLGSRHVGNPLPALSSPASRVPAPCPSPRCWEFKLSLRSRRSCWRAKAKSPATQASSNYHSRLAWKSHALSATLTASYALSSHLIHESRREFSLVWPEVTIVDESWRKLSREPTLSLGKIGWSKRSIPPYMDLFQL